jgi:hypothetical protein
MIYRTKLINNITAEPWAGNPCDIERFGLVVFPEIDKHAIFQETHKGLVRVERGDMIVFMPCGEKYVLPPEIFRKLFHLQESAQ